MDTAHRWDGLVVNTNLATLQGDAGYAAVEDGALAWKDGLLVFAGPRSTVPGPPGSLAAEVIGQVWIANKSFGSVPAKIDRAITNVVMMGMGEPLLNFDNVVAAMKIMMDDLGYGISKRKVTLSTSGVVPMIDKLGMAG